MKTEIKTDVVISLDDYNELKSTYEKLMTDPNLHRSTLIKNECYPYGIGVHMVTNDKMVADLQSEIANLRGRIRAFEFNESEKKRKFFLDDRPMLIKWALNNKGHLLFALGILTGLLISLFKS